MEQVPTAKAGFLKKIPFFLPIIFLPACICRQEYINILQIWEIISRALKDSFFLDVYWINSLK